MGACALCQVANEIKVRHAKAERIWAAGRTAAFPLQPARTARARHLAGQGALLACIPLVYRPTRVYLLLVYHP